MVTYWQHSLIFLLGKLYDIGYSHEYKTFVREKLEDSSWGEVRFKFYLFLILILYDSGFIFGLEYHHYRQILEIHCVKVAGLIL